MVEDHCEGMVLTVVRLCEGCLLVSGYRLPTTQLTCHTKADSQFPAIQTHRYLIGIVRGGNCSKERMW